MPDRGLGCRGNLSSSCSAGSRAVNEETRVNCENVGAKLGRVTAGSDRDPEILKYKK